MKINFNSALININGKTIQMDDGEGKEVLKRDMLLKDACIGALVAPLQGEEREAGDKKFARGVLATKIYQAQDEIEITAEEAAMLKDRIGRGYSTAVVHAAWQYLDG